VVSSPKSVQRGIDDTDVLLENGTKVLDVNPAPAMHPGFMQKTLTMFTQFLKCSTIFESNVTSNDVFNSIGHNCPLHAYRTPFAIKSKMFPAR